MQLLEALNELGIPQIGLARESGVARFKLYEFLYGDTKLTPTEEAALRSVLQREAVRKEQALSIIRQAASA